MNLSNGFSATFGLARVAFGVFASSAPERLGRSWIGEEASGPGSEVILRALGFRDIALGAGTAEAALRGDPRSWLAVSMLSDLGDVAATVIGRNRIDQRGVVITSAVAGAGAFSAALLLALSSKD